jgi:thiol-disulfide isomerase/thioredoxin
MKFVQEYGSTILIVSIGLFILYRLFVPRTHALVGQSAPAFRLTNLAGQEVALADHLGKDVVVLDFWASWCPPCRKGLPVLDSVAKAYAGEPVAVYGVNIREGKSLVQNFLRDRQLSLNVLLDETGMVADDYGVSGIPQTVIIDKTGQITNIHVGVSPLGFEKALKADIAAALSPSGGDDGGG